MTTTDNLVQLDKYRAIEDIVKQRLGAINVLFIAELPNDQILTFIPHELLDMNLVYMIQTLKDRRLVRVTE